MVQSTTLTLVDGVRIVVPDCLDLITPYVLREQGDWFEDEIKFVRRLLQPGQRAIDIGANYGVYTLSMAKAVGPTGRVWAFEPASDTAAMLAAGIAENGFRQVVLERSAMSSAAGTGSLSLNGNSELNSLLHDGIATGNSETVSVVAMDDCLETCGWQGIDFLKIDAEGEELNILRGATRFFSLQSPLVQYEVKAGADLSLDLVRAFADLGYRSYRLVPGLDLLIPFDLQAPIDGFLLNLFCCKPDRAARLAAEGWLLDAKTDLQRIIAERPNSVLGRLKTDFTYGWDNTLTKLPYGALLADTWERTAAGGVSDEVEDALSLYAYAQDRSAPVAERFAALDASFMLLKDLCAAAPVHLRLFSLARVAREYGARSLAVGALEQFLNALAAHQQVDPSEPFLAPGRDFESVSPRGDIRDWVLAAALEEFERTSDYSSFYKGASGQQRLAIIQALGYGSPEMQRRMDLLQQRLASTR